MHQYTPINPISCDVGLPDDVNHMCGTPPRKPHRSKFCGTPKTTAEKHMWKIIIKTTLLHGKIPQNPCQLLKWFNPLLIPSIIHQVVGFTCTPWETLRPRSNTNISSSDIIPTSTPLSNHPKLSANSSW